MTDAIIYTKTTMVVDGITEGVKYRLRKNGNVVVHMLSADCDMELAPSDEGYADALAAAKAYKAECSQLALANREAQQAEGKLVWEGTVIKGRGWKIMAGTECWRIQVKFARKPELELIEAVKDAKFCWSPSTKSWNRGMKQKAWRDAQKLALTLKMLQDKEHRELYVKRGMLDTKYGKAV